MRYALAILLLSLFSTISFAAEKESAYDRVVKTRTLRCAYTTYPPFIIKDAKTGEMSGLFYELTNELGRQLNLKVDWTEEVGSDSILEGLRTGRYDAVCAGYTSTPSRAWGGDFLKPMVFGPFELYIRADETRFKSLDDFNKPDVTLATMDGELSQVVANEIFPLAKQASVPGLTPGSDRMMMVATKKADAVPIDAPIGREYMANNPGKVKLFSDKPLRLAGSTLIIPLNEFALKSMLNTAVDAMQWNGITERITKKYTKYPGAFLMPALVYQPVGEQ